MFCKIFFEGPVGKKGVAREKSSCENVSSKNYELWKEETLIAFVVLITNTLCEVISLNNWC